ncbi:MAG: ATP-binding protein [Actinomycetota bacterium]
MDRVILTTDLRFEQDIVLARQRARQVAALLGFDTQDQTRIATAVSEIARNAFEYARGGKVTFSVSSTPLSEQAPIDLGYRGLAPGVTRYFVIRIADSGPGIADLQSVLDGR